MHEAHIERLDAATLAQDVSILSEELAESFKVSVNRSMERWWKHDGWCASGLGRA